MKTRLLWILILSVGNAALFFGIVRPEVSMTPKRVQDYLAKDPATLPPVKLPAFVVSESRLTTTPSGASGPRSDADGSFSHDHGTLQSVSGAPRVNASAPDRNSAGNETGGGTQQAEIGIGK